MREQSGPRKLLKARRSDGRMYGNSHLISSDFEATDLHQYRNYSKERASLTITRPGNCFHTYYIFVSLQVRLRRSVTAMATKGVKKVAQIPLQPLQANPPRDVILTLIENEPKMEGSFFSPVKTRIINYQTSEF